LGEATELVSWKEDKYGRIWNNAISDFSKITREDGKLETTSSFRLIGIVNGKKLEKEDGVTKLLRSYMLVCG